MPPRLLRETIRPAAEPFVIHGERHIDIGDSPDPDKIAQIGEARQKLPANKAKIQKEKLRFVSGHHPFALADTVHGGQLRMVDQKIDRHTVAVGSDETGNNKQKGPEHDENEFKDIQQNNASCYAEAVQQVAKAGAGAADGVEQENNKAHAYDVGHDLQRQIDELSRHRRGMRFQHRPGLFHPALKGVLHIPVHFIQGESVVEPGREKGNHDGQRYAHQPGVNGTGFGGFYQILSGQFGAGTVKHSGITPFAVFDTPNISSGLRDVKQKNVRNGGKNT